MIVSEDVTIDGLQLVRYSSNKYVKIMNNNDHNIYPVAYVVKGSTVSFAETNIPLNEISVGGIVTCDDVIGLSNYISSTVDYLSDGKYDNMVKVDLGGANE